MAEERKVLELMGAPGSPYTRKMLAVMRFRNISYRLERQSRMVEAGLLGRKSGKGFYAYAKR